MAASIHLGSGILGHPSGAVMRRYRRGWLRGYVQPHRAPWPAAFASSSAVAVWEFLIIFESFFWGLWTQPVSVPGIPQSIVALQTWGFAEHSLSFLGGPIKK